MLFHAFLTAFVTSSSVFLRVQGGCTRFAAPAADLLDHQYAALTQADSYQIKSVIYYRGGMSIVLIGQ